MKDMLSTFIGKEINIWPHDTYSKYGTLLNVGEQGILVKSNGGKSSDVHWAKDGTIFFIAYSHNLTFKVID